MAHILSPRKEANTSWFATSSRLYKNVILVTLTLMLAACGHDIDVQGYRWHTTSTLANDDAVLDIDLVVNAANGGVLFLAETYANDPVPYGSALPFTYTWDGNSGTIDITGGTCRLPLVLVHNTTGEGKLEVDMSPLRIYHPYLAETYTLDRMTFHRAPSVAGTVWLFSVADNGYIYTLALGDTSGTLRLVRTTSEGDSTYAAWDIANYSLSDGIATMVIRNVMFNEKYNGYFYMPDDRHLCFFDGESMLPFVCR